MIFLKGKNVRFADNILLKAKLPPDISRTLRPVVDRPYYKANEYRSIAFYVAFRMIRDILDQRYLFSVIKYILFLRILCQEVVSKEDVVTSQRLIEEFSHEYQVLFGRGSMTYNLHAHLHLPLQVWRYGPLNRYSAFPFESIFQLNSRDIHGTRNFDGQIARNVEKRQITKIKLKNIVGKCSPEVNYFISEYLLRNSHSKKCSMINPSRSLIKDLSQCEISLLLRNKIYDERQEIFTSQCAWLNFKSMKICLSINYLQFI